MPIDLPNLLTLSRIACLPVLMVFTAVGRPWADAAACGVFAAAAVTDYLDGWLARRSSRTSDLGRMLDPIADKLLVGATLMLLIGHQRLSPSGLYPAIAILLREIAVSGLREYLGGRGIGLPVTRLAKWKTGTQMGALGSLLAGDSGAGVLGVSFFPVGLLGEAALWVAAALTVLTGWNYLTVGWHHAAASPTQGQVQPPRFVLDEP